MTVLELVGVVLALWVFTLAALVVGWLVIESTARYAEALVAGRKCATCELDVSATDRAVCNDCGVQQ